VVLALACALLLSAASEEPAAATPPEASVVYLKDGRVLRGVFIDRDATTITLDTSTGRVAFDESLLRRIVGPPLPPRCAPGGDLPVALTLPGGRRVEGVVTRRCEGSATLRLPDGTSLTVRDSDLGSAAGALPAPPRPPPRPWRSDVLRLRSLASPTALAPGHGEIVASTAQLTLAVEVGLLRHLSARLASTAPFLYAEPFGRTLDASVGAHAAAGPLHVRAGVQASVASTARPMVYALGAATLGGPDAQLTLYAGPPLPGGAQAGDFGARILSLGGAYRISSFLAITGEAWMGLEGSRELAGAGALRLLNEPVAVELGAAVLPGSTRVAPWVAAAWQVRGGR
jgi:hypothetical protein